MYTNRGQELARNFVMPHLIYPLAASFFCQRLQPTLARSWRQRSFAPCRELCEELLSRVRDYHRDYHGLAEKTLVEQAAASLSFDRHTWRALTGEILLFAAREVPLLQLPAETLCCLLAPATLGTNLFREHFPPIHQALFGSHDLVFAGGYYRPDSAGCNNPEDVARLSAYLRSIDANLWQPAQLAALPDFPDDEDRAEELAFARQCWPGLVEVYRQAECQQDMLICEID